MKNTKKLFIYIFLSVLITLFITNIYLKADNGYFKYMSVALTNSKEEISTTYYFDTLETLKKEFMENPDYYNDTYNIYLEMIPDDIENKDKFIVPYISSVLDPTLNTLAIKHQLNIYFQVCIASIALGILIYVVTHVSFKFSWLKLILGYIICLIITCLAGALVIGIKGVIHFHLLKYILATILIYAVIIGINFISQKNRINKLNKELNK